jgi:hypothetical protein
MSRTWVVVIGVLTAMLLVLLYNQVQLGHRVDAMLAGNSMAAPAPASDTATLERLQRQLDAMERRLNDLSRRSDMPMDPLPPRVTGRSRGPIPLIFTPEAPLTKPGPRGWGPEQATGAPDTMQAGDMTTAWAPRQPDGGAEWLKLEFNREVMIAEVRVRETYNPGAVVKVTALLAGGEEALIWEGAEEPAQAPVDRSFLNPQPIKARMVKIYLDTAKVSGWNEIDAVELIGTDGSRQWASTATASSSYADIYSPALR